MKHNHQITGSIEFGDIFVPFADAAIARLSVLFPDVDLNRIADCCVNFVLPDEDSISANGFRREFLHSLYREKIYQETLGMRQRLIEALTQ